MKLFYSNTSPYSRKVRVLIFEKKRQSNIECVLVNPFKGDAALLQANPFGKTPTLIENQ